MSGPELTAHIIEKSMKDPAFRQRLLADPKSTIEQETGQPYPPGMRIKVVEEDSDVLVLAIPKVPAAASGELSEAELETVAGGGCTFGGTTYQVICFCGSRK